jgi:hypothetical protein
MALDFSTPGAIFLFLLLIGVLNSLFKAAARGGPLAAGLIAVGATGSWLDFYGRDAGPVVDFYSPGMLLSAFLVCTTWIQLPLALRGASLALNRSELVLVYAMLLIVSAVCTMGLSEQILPIITAVFYFASPENNWQERLIPDLPKRIMVDDGTGSRLFYEGLSGPGDSIPYASWVEPLAWWGLFLVALYVAMICAAIIVRRQWMERERLAYPIAQVGLSMNRRQSAGPAPLLSRGAGATAAVGGALLRATATAAYRELYHARLLVFHQCEYRCRHLVLSSAGTHRKRSVRHRRHQVDDEVELWRRRLSLSRIPGRRSVAGYGPLRFVGRARALWWRIRQSSGIGPRGFGC